MQYSSNTRTKDNTGGYYDQRRYSNQEYDKRTERTNCECDSCSQGIISMYDAYIDGLKELDEINREFNAHYEVDDKRGGNRGGCSMM